MERTSFNRVSNLGVKGIKSSQVDQSPLSEEELSQQFPSLDYINTSTQVFNLLNLINRLCGNLSSAFAASARIPQPTDKQLILALFNLGGSLNLVDAQKFLKFCRDDNLIEGGINFKRIHGYFENNSHVRNSITSDEFDAYINNQPGGDQVATLVENVVYNSPSARQIGVETLLRLLVAPSKHIDQLKYFLEVVADFAFVENDPIDKESMQKLAQQLDQHVYKQSDVIVILVNKIKSNVAGSRAAIAHPGYTESRLQDAFQTNTNNPTQSNPQSLANQPLVAGEIPFGNRKDVLQQLRTYVPLNGALTANYELTNNNDIFPLVNKINEFIDDKNQAVLVILGDGGTGKSLFMQWLTTDLLNQKDSKKCFPLYVELNDVSDSNDIFRQQFGLNSDALRELSSQYQIVLIADGFDQMPNKVNLYVANKLNKFNIKLIVSTRTNTLPDAYLEFFNPRIVHKNQSSGMMQVYLQQFNSSQIDDYIANYIKENKSELEQQIALNQLTSQWLNPDYTKTQIQKITGLYQLMHIPFMCSLILAEIPKLISLNQSRITAYQAYEIIIKKWINSQIIGKVLPVSVEAVFEFAQKLAFTLHLDNLREIDLSQISSYINPEKGIHKKTKLQDRWDWFKEATTIRLALPLELAKPNIHRFMHKSIQEFLVAYYLYTQLMRASEFTNLDWNKITLSNDDPTSNSILLLLVDILSIDNSFRDKLTKLSEYAKVNNTQTTALANINNLYLYEYLKLGLLVEKNDANQVSSMVIQILSDQTLDIDEKMKLLSAIDKAGYSGFYLALQNGHAPVIKEFVTLILNVDSSILSPANKLELLLAKANDGIPGFSMALYNGHTEVIKQFITLILNADSSILSPANKLELLLAKANDGPGFYMTLFNGHAFAIKEFITLILNADSSILSPANKLELLLAKDKDGFSGFYVALQNGHAPAIKEFITLILNADSLILSPADKLELLLAKDKDGAPGFYVALQDGHASAIKEFISLILNADSSILNPANKLELLLAKRSDGVPGLFISLQQGHAEAIKQFINLILSADSSILSTANKLELLLAKGNNGAPGLFIASQQGHAEAVKEFITLILNADSSILSPANKLELLLAKNKGGFPGFYVALRNGHAEAVKEFITLILNADSSILSPANKLELLLAKNKDGIPGFFMVLYNGRAPAIREFVTLILNVDSSILSPANKLELLLAKRGDGLPGFHLALQNGHAEAIDEFINLIYNAPENILTQEDKMLLLLARNREGQLAIADWDKQLDAKLRAIKRQ